MKPKKMIYVLLYRNTPTYAARTVNTLFASFINNIWSNILI
ncbi:hypothetical protein MtrunA17_Chr4g0053581 [Medicago truncatula]|uniref:Uncharacterized protein n=1 Tax=Medicago truncatula TaxID=3880 RepID=A0A396IBM4_MEDTR|nr:hypothetical protein MtrunA17_Chr4g0053581 [Medicago truncatula]